MCVTIHLRCQQPTEMSTISSYDKIATKKQVKFQITTCARSYFAEWQMIWEKLGIWRLNFSNIPYINFSYQAI